jgi:unconventional prefoldin RPB5 interactor 1
MQNVGPNAVVRIDEVKEAQAPAANDEKSTLVKAPSTEKKAVRFAEELDISPAPETTPPTPLKPETNLPPKSPLGDIVERAPPKQDATTATLPTKKPSRFKSARAGNQITMPMMPPLQPLEPVSEPRIAPSGPKGKTIANSIVERETPAKAPAEPDELDPNLLHQEVATEYHRVRNRMILKQGGFMRNTEEEETGIIPLTEEEGGPKKMSRFKAARLAKMA